MNFSKIVFVMILILIIGLYYTSNGIVHIVGEGSWNIFDIGINNNILQISILNNNYLINFKPLINSFNEKNKILKANYLNIIEKKYYYLKVAEKSITNYKEEIKEVWKYTLNKIANISN